VVTRQSPPALEELAAQIHASAWDLALAAVDEGLGAWYFGITRGEAEVQRTLAVPNECKLLGVIVLGYPSPDDQPRGSMLSRRRRAFESMFHFGRW
jgi:hypothetical protein